MFKHVIVCNNITKHPLFQTYDLGKFLKIQQTAHIKQAEIGTTY